MQVFAIKNPSINSKISGMYAKRLKSEYFEELLKQSTIKQVIALLKSFNDGFKDLEDNPRRINIKILLDEMLIEDIIKLYRLLNKNDKKVFFEFISIYEIKCIKSVFRKIVSNSVINEETNEVQIWVQKIFNNLVGIDKVKNYEDFVHIISRTPYYFLFKNIDDIDNVNVFEIENKLDKFYFENIMKISKKYNNTMEGMIGKQIDLNNIIWIYRIKKYYNFSEEKIKEILINKNYKLTKSELNELIQANNEKDIRNILSKTYYAKYIEFENITELEESIDRYLYSVYKKVFRGNIFDIGILYAYIYMADMENNDIMNIVEGIRYDMDRDEIRKKLVKGI